MKQEFTATDFKDQGNKLYAAHKYDDAVNCYTRAISKNPSVATFFTNRALCHLKLQQWEASCSDCRRALDIEPNLIKGHFFLGQGLIELELYDEAMKHLQRAQDLAKDQKLNFGDEISYQLRLCRKKRWDLIEKKRMKEESELQSYLHKLILRDRDENLVDGPKSDLYLAQVDELFALHDERRRKREVPDYLCGKISFEILKEPVVTPCGITYDRKDIVEHLQRVGHFDPVTRQPLTVDKLIPNLSMKEVVDAFLAENEWANEY